MIFDLSSVVLLFVMLQYLQCDVISLLRVSRRLGEVVKST